MLGVFEGLASEISDSLLSGIIQSRGISRFNSA